MISNPVVLFPSSVSLEPEFSQGFFLMSLGVFPSIVASGLLIKALNLHLDFSKAAL